MYMTKEQFLELQLQQQSSGVSAKDFCHQQSISYFTFIYWLFCKLCRDFVGVLKKSAK